MTAATKRSCPSSTPTLKNSSATGIAWSGRPTSLSAPAKPRPCSRPKAKATSHGRRAVRLCPAAPRIHDLHRDEHDAERDRRLDRRAGHMRRSRASPRASVMLCATVKAVTVSAMRFQPPHQDDERQHEEQMVDAEEDVLDAEPEIGGGHLLPARSPPARRRRGWPASARAVLVSPFSRSMRTSTSVRLAARPSIAMVSPAKPAGRMHRPPLDIGVVQEDAFARRRLGRALGQARVEREPELAHRRRLPEDGIGVRRALGDREIGGPQVMRLRLPGDDGQKRARRRRGGGSRRGLGQLLPAGLPARPRP